MRKSKKFAATPSPTKDALLDDMVQLLARSAAREAAASENAPSILKNTTSKTAHGNRCRVPPARSSHPSSTLGDRHGARAHRARAEEDVADSDCPIGSLDDDPATRPLILRDIASQIGASEDVTRDLLRKQKIAGFKVGGQWRAMPAAISEYLIKQLSRR